MFKQIYSSSNWKNFTSENVTNLSTPAEGRCVSLLSMRTLSALPAVGVDLEELLDGGDLVPDLGSGVEDGLGGVVGVSSAVAELKSLCCHSSVMAAVVGKQ